MTLRSEKAPVSSAVQPRRQLREALGRTARLTRKELREILRDPRTVVTLVLMPLILYPILSITLGTFLVSSPSGEAEPVYAVAFESKKDWDVIGPYLSLGERALARPSERSGEGQGRAEKDSAETPQRAPSRPDVARPRLAPNIGENLEEEVGAAKWDLAIRRQQLDGAGANGPIVCELIYRDGAPNSEAALHYVERCLYAANERSLERRLQQLRRLGFKLERLGLAATSPTELLRKPVETTVAPAFSLATVVPLILVLMTITGAVYPAIDLTAGERERGTLEILMASPAPRFALLMAKYVAVLTVSLLTATINMVAMTATIFATGLGQRLFGPAGLSMTVVALVFGLMILYASFFSAVLLTLTSFARSFKEAQLYLIPLMLASVTPGLLGLTPGLEFNGILAVTPLINVVLLARDLFEGGADPVLALTAVISTAFYAVAAIAAAARVFGGDAILLGSRGGWSDVLRRPRRTSPAPDIAAALLCLALVFPAYFLLENLLARAQETSLPARLTAAGLIAAVVLGAFPLAIAAYYRVRLRECYGLKAAAPQACLAAIVLGLSMWPFAYEAFLVSEYLGVTTLNSEHVPSAQGLARDLSRIPLAHVLVWLALAPALFEECFFRGIVFSAFRRRMGAMGAILLSSLAFAAFHVAAPAVLAIERFLPSMLLGVILAWARHRTGSLLPPILLHACHNGLLLLVTYYRDGLTSFGWAVQQQRHLPLAWLAAAAVSAAAGAALLAWTSKRTSAVGELTLSAAADVEQNVC